MSTIITLRTTEFENALFYVSELTFLRVFEGKKYVFLQIFVVKVENLATIMVEIFQNVYFNASHNGHYNEYQCSHSEPKSRFSAVQT